MYRYLLAFPTNDSFKITKGFTHAKEIRVLSIEDGEVNREYVIQKGDKNLFSILTKISDEPESNYTKSWLVLNSEEVTAGEIIPKSFEIYRVSETNITNAVNHIIRKVLPSESDFLCQP